MPILSNYNNIHDYNYIIQGSILGNIIIYLILLYNNNYFKKLKINIPTFIDFIINIIIIISSIYSARYFNNLFHKDTMNIYNFFLLILIIQLVKRILMDELYTITKEGIFYNNNKINIKLYILDAVNVLLSLCIALLLKKHYI
jgi:hypothetical protein